MSIENNWLTEKPFAHRGLHDGSDRRPENSLAAFEAAIDSGLGIELDVRPSRDHVPVVFHDPNLQRMSGRPERVDQMTAAELQGVALNGGTEKIPTLAQVLDLVRGRVPLLIDLKHPLLSPPRLLAKPIAAAVKSYTGTFGVMSFCPMTIQWFRLCAPHIARGQLIGVNTPREFAHPVTAAMGRMFCSIFWGKPQFVAYEVDALPAQLGERARSRMPVVAWTVRDAKTRELAQRHADNFIFDRLRTG